jgi:hypothetical protein
MVERTRSRQGDIATALLSSQNLANLNTADIWRKQEGKNATERAGSNESMTRVFRARDRILALVLYPFS